MSFIKNLILLITMLLSLETFFVKKTSNIKSLDKTYGIIK